MDPRQIPTGDVPRGKKPFPSLKDGVPEPAGGNPKKMFFRAKEMMRDNRFQDAAALLERAADIHPRDTFIAHSLIDCYAKLGQTEKARAVFGRLVSSGLANDFSYSTMVKAYVSAGDADKAMEIARMADAAGCPNTFVCTPVFEAYKRAGRLDLARELLGIMHKKHLADAVVYSSMLQAYSRAGMVKEAGEIFEMALQEKKADSILCTTMFSCYKAAGLLSRAKEVYDLAVGTLHLNDPRLHADMMLLYKDAGMPEKAVEMFLSIPAQCQDAVLYRAGMRCLYECRMFREVEAVYEAAPPEIKADDDIRLRAMEAGKKLKKYDATIAKADAFLAEGTHEEEMRHWAGLIKVVCLSGLGRAQDAISLLRELGSRIGPASHNFARKECMRVFLGDFSGEEAPDIMRSLRDQLSRKTGNCFRDIRNAIRELERMLRAAADGLQHQF